MENLNDIVMDCDKRDFKLYNIKDKLHILETGGRSVKNLMLFIVLLAIIVCDFFVLFSTSDEFLLTILAFGNLLLIWKGTFLFDNRKIFLYMIKPKKKIRLPEEYCVVKFGGTIKKCWIDKEKFKVVAEHEKNVQFDLEVLPDVYKKILLLIEVYSIFLAFTEGEQLIVFDVISFKEYDKKRRKWWRIWKFKERIIGKFF